MRRRWSGAGMLVAEQHLRRIISYRDLAELLIAIERHALLVAAKNRDRQRPTSPLPRDCAPTRCPTDVPRRSGPPRRSHCLGEGEERHMGSD
jgi:hypothetical protein